MPTEEKQSSRSKCHACGALGKPTKLPGTLSSDFVASWHFGSQRNRLYCMPCWEAGKSKNRGKKG